MRKNRGQASLEFLMTYGWAIVVIGVVTLILWQWGVFNMTGNVRPSYLGFWGVAPIDFKYKSNGDMIFSFQNNIADGDINITAINVTTGGESYSTPPSQLPIPLSAGNITEASGWLLRQTDSGMPKYNPGSSYNIFVTIEYVDNRLGADTKFRSSGTIQGSVES